MKGCAGEQWFTDFMKHNNKVVSLWKSQATSLARTTAFNRYVFLVVFPETYQCSGEA
jgi:hypothetical protein